MSQAALVASDHAADGKYHLLLAASGSVATIKIPNIVQALADTTNLSIRIVVTESAAQFLQGQSHEQPKLEEIKSYPNVEAIYRDADEWNIPWTRGAPILHIELRRWADAMVIAPLSADTLAKISNGICDNLLTSIIRAWQVEPEYGNYGTDGRSRQKPILVAPAMNTAMWRHPLTKQQLYGSPESEVQTSPYGLPRGPYWWIEVLKPIEKTLACGDTGDGAMHDWKAIVQTIKERIIDQGPVRHLASV